MVNIRPRESWSMTETKLGESGKSWVGESHKREGKVKPWGCTIKVQA